MHGGIGGRVGDKGVVGCRGGEIESAVGGEGSHLGPRDET